MKLLHIFFLAIIMIGCCTTPVSAIVFNKTISASDAVYIRPSLTNLTFPELRVAPGASLSRGTTISWYATSNSTSPYIQYNRRGVVTVLTNFTAAGIPSNAIIQNWSLNLYSQNPKYNGLGAFDATIIDAFPTNPLSLVAGDYGRTTFTEITTNITYFAFSTGGWNNFTSTNISYINATGTTAFMLSVSDDTYNSTLTWAALANSGYVINSSSGPNAPSLTINYIIPPPIISFTPTGTTSGTAPLTVQFNDISTGTPTSWVWGAKNSTPGNNSWETFSTVQNATQVFGIGNWQINLTASNVWGSNTSTQVTFVNVSGILAQFNPPGPITLTYPSNQRFDDISTGSPTSWEWIARNATGNNVSYIFNTTQNATFFPKTLGNFTISLNASTASAFGISTQVTWANVSSGVDFTTNVTEGTSYPLAVAFTDTTTAGTPYNWSWDFGDTSASILQNPTHVYTGAGNFTANLTVYNSTIGFASATHYINLTFATQSLVSQFTPSTESNIWMYTGSVKFTDTTTGNPTVWNWSYNADGVGSQIPFNTTRNATFFPPSIGNFLMSLNASSAIYSNVSTQITWVNVTFPPNPIIDFVANTTTPTVLHNVQFNDTSANYPTAWEWDFGDGTTSTQQNPIHAYASTGLKDITLHAYLAANATITNTSTKIGYINVGGVSTVPSADFVGIPTLTTTGSIVSFTDLSTNTPTSWLWNFGDLSGSTLQNPTHVYTAIGNYTVNLTATNPSGSDTKTRLHYINITSGGSSGFNQQDLVMTPQFILTVNIVDSTTNLSIPVVLVIDSLGNNQTTTIGEFVGTYPYSTVVLYLTSSGYDSKAASYIMDSDRTETVQMVKTATAPIQGSTTWYVPKTIEFRVVNYANNQLPGVNLTAKFNASSTLLGGMEDLKTWYGMNPTAANEATNGTLIMTGITDTQGVVVLTMLSTLSYDVYVTSGGTTNYFNVHPQNSPYLLRFVTISGADTSLTHCVYNNGNTHTGLAAPNPYNMTLMWSYQDTCGLTTALDYIVKDVNNGSFIIYNYHLTPVTSGIYVNNLTLSNTRGANYIWYENATRSV